MPRATLSMSEREWRALVQVTCMYAEENPRDKEMIKIADKIEATWKRARDKKHENQHRLE